MLRFVNRITALAGLKLMIQATRDKVTLLEAQKLAGLTPAEQARIDGGIEEYMKQYYAFVGQFNGDKFWWQKLEIIPVKR